MNIKKSITFIFSIVFALLNCDRGTEPTSTVQSIEKPTAGEKYFSAEPITVEWTGDAKEVELLLSLDDGNIFESVAYTSTGSNTGTFSIANYSNTGCKIKLQNRSNPSDFAISNSFTIRPLLLKSPVGGESYSLGQELTISWNADTLFVSTIDLLISDDGGKSWEQINTSGSIDIKVHSNFIWTIDDKGGKLTFPSNECRVKIKDYDVGTINDNGLDFSIN